MAEWFRNLLNDPRKAQDEAPVAAPEAPLALQSDRQVVTELLLRVERLEGQQSALRMEWAEMLDKISRWFSRQAGRRASEAKAAMEEEGQQQVPAPETPARNGQLTKAELRQLAARMGR